MSGQKRTPAGVPAGGEFAANEHDEAASALSAEDRRLAVDFDLHPDYVGWVKVAGERPHYEKPGGEKVYFDPYDERGWYAESASGEHLGSWKRLDDAISEADERAARPIPPTPKDPSLEPRLLVAPRDELEPVPGDEHPLYPGAGYGVTYSEHWGDFRVETGYFGMQPQEGSVRPEHPLRWTSDQSSFERSAVIWQHREDIDRALREAGHTDRYRLRIEVEADRFVISEYDHGSFNGITTPRRDV